MGYAGVAIFMTFSQLIEVEPSVQTEFALTDEGEHVLQHGSHEFVVYTAVPEEGILMSDLMVFAPHEHIIDFRKPRNMPKLV